MSEKQDAVIEAKLPSSDKKEDIKSSLISEEGIKIEQCHLKIDINKL